MDSVNPMNWFGSDKYEQKLIQDPPANDLYKKGVVEMEKRDYETSSKTFSKLEKAYPYSQYQRKGLLMTTYTQYQDKKYDDAVGSAKRYLGLYPNSPDTPYVHLPRGHGLLRPDPRRETTILVARSRRSRTFKVIIDKYHDVPNTPATPVTRCRSRATSSPARRCRSAATTWSEASTRRRINRFRAVLAKYQTTRQTEEALERLTEAYLAIGLPQEAQTAAAVLGHNYPNSDWYKQSYSLLQHGGLAPSEDKGSWISRTMRGLPGVG